MLYHEHQSEHGTLIADFSRQRITKETLQKLIALANKVGSASDRNGTPDCNEQRWQTSTSNEGRQIRFAAVLLAICGAAGMCIFDTSTCPHHEAEQRWVEFSKYCT